MFYKNINSNIWNKYNKDDLDNFNQELLIFSNQNDNKIKLDFINYVKDFLEKNPNHIVLNNSYFAKKLLKYNLFTSKSIATNNNLIYKKDDSNLNYQFICSNEIVDKENPINILFNDKYNIHIYYESNLDNLQYDNIENIEKSNEQKVNIYTMSNKENIHLKRLLNSAEYYGVKIDVIRPEIWTSNLMKIELLKEKLESHKPDDIVMLIDAWDIIISADSEMIYQQFLKFNSNVIFSSTFGGNLWARHSEEEREVEREYYSRNPKSPTIYDILCAGSFIGYAESLLDIINHMMSKYTELNTKSEQSFYTRYFIDYPEKIKLDYYQVLFSCENPVKTNKRRYWLFGRSYKTSPDNLRVIDNKTYNQITKTNPSIIHTPSYQYEYLDKLYYRHIFNDDSILRYELKTKNNLFYYFIALLLVFFSYLIKPYCSIF